MILSTATDNPDATDTDRCPFKSSSKQLKQKEKKKTAKDNQTRVLEEILPWKVTMDFPFTR